MILSSEGLKMLVRSQPTERTQLFWNTDDVFSLESFREGADASEIDGIFKKTVTPP